MSKVALMAINPDANQETIHMILGQSLQLLEDDNNIKAQSKILIKPNFGTTFYEKSINPKMLKAALFVFAEKNIQF